MNRILVLYSPFETKEQVAQRWDPFIESLGIGFANKQYATEYYNDADCLKKSLQEELDPHWIILIMGSGGTERLAQIVATSGPAPLLMVCDNRVNSLAAALEAHYVIRQQRAVKFLYVENLPDALHQARLFLGSAETLHKLNAARFGMVGGPSPWLLTSDGVNGFGSFTTTLVPIDIGELLQEFENIDQHYAADIAADLESNYGEVLVDQQSLLDSAKAYLAMEKIISLHQLDGITIRCFDLLPHQFTACMGMSLCAGREVISTCEGDLHAAFSMMVGQWLGTGYSWMANPSSVNIQENTITFAHCTVPEGMLSARKHSTLTTHMESGLSTAISGPLHLQEITILRSGGNFNSIHAASGQIIDTHMKNSSLCRTQAVVKLHVPVQNWLENTNGNHQVIVYGNLLEQLSDFCLLAGISLRF